jgi:hypothetical protein
MSFDDYKKWVDIDMQYLDKRIALLGGEPTIHAEFGNFLEYALTKTDKVTVFTNLMATKKNAKDLIRIAAANPELSVVWNNSEFDTVPEVHRIDSSRLATELNKLCYMFYSVTYTPGLDLSYLLDATALTGIRKVRFALNVSDMHLMLDPVNLSSLVEQLQLLINNGLTVIPDRCGFIPNSTPAFYKLKLLRLLGELPRCSSGAMDVLPDGRIIPCQPYLDDPKDVFVEDASKEDFHELLVSQYGPQSFRQVTHGLCPAIYERPTAGKIIPITLI